MASSVPMTRPGPLVHGRQTSLHLMSSIDFVKSPFCQPVMSFMNASFSHLHPPYITSSFIRMNTTDQYAGEIGGIESDSRPFGSVFVLVFSEPLESDPYGLGVIATGGCKVSAYSQPAKLFAKLDENGRRWSRPESICTRMPSTVDWELKLLVTGLEYQKQGIASYLLEVCYGETRRRTSKAERVLQGLEEPDWDTEYVIDADLKRDLTSAGGIIGNANIRILLTTLEELNGKFYERKGYTRDLLVPFSAGTMGGTVAFNAVHMSKTLER